jgi:multidrug efflux pump subunit AcrA (membrane-fusion protein)
VRTVIPTADRQKATVKVRITIIDLEKYNFILPDMGVKVAFLENEQPAAKDKSKDKEKGPQAVAFIPKSAVRSDSNASFVFLVRDGKVERRAVNLGMDRGTDVAVLAGVSPGDALVVKGPESLHDGEKVEIRQ